MRRGEASTAGQAPARRTAFARRRGIMVMDALFGLGLLALLTTVLIVSVGQHRRGERRLADQQAAWAVAERALAELAQGRPLPAMPESAAVSWAPLDRPAPVPGRQWVELRVSFEDARATLVGLAPAAAAVEPTQPSTAGRETP